MHGAVFLWIFLLTVYGLSLTSEELENSSDVK